MLNDQVFKDEALIVPDWPAPANVKALQTTRRGGVSVAPYHSLNLAGHVGDDPLMVAANRQLLNRYVPTEPLWLEQVHGVQVVNAASASCLPTADAAYSTQRGAVCTVMTADCLPLLLCNVAGSEVAAVHAGWKGLLDGVIEAAVNTMQSPRDQLLVWMGPAIGPQAFAVGDDVRDAYVRHNAAAAAAFIPQVHDDKLDKQHTNNSHAGNQGSGNLQAGNKWLADIYQLARLRLLALGVTQVYGGGLCTYSDEARFFSFRRDGATGRMASMVWLA